MSTPRYAILQATLEIPEVAQLQQAFREVRGLLPADAYALAADAYGLLIRNLSLPAAQKLHTALTKAGIACDCVLHTSLPVLPPTRFVRRVECQTGSLRVDDALGRLEELPWNHLRLIAAGWIEARRPVDGRAALVSSDSSIQEDRGHAHETNSDPDARQAGRGLIELIFFGLGSRLTVDVQDAARILGEPAESVLLRLATALMKHAPTALRNRGVDAALRDPPGLFRYPSRNAFHEELIWMLWKAQAGADEAPPPGR